MALSTWDTIATPTLTTIITNTNGPVTLTLGPTNSPIPLTTMTKDNGDSFVCVPDTRTAAPTGNGCVPGWEQIIQPAVAISMGAGAYSSCHPTSVSTAYLASGTIVSLPNDTEDPAPTITAYSQSVWIPSPTITDSSPSTYSANLGDSSGLTSNNVLVSSGRAVDPTISSNTRSETSALPASFYDTNDGGTSHAETFIRGTLTSGLDTTALPEASYSSDIEISTGPVGPITSNGLTNVLEPSAVASTASNIELSSGTLISSNDRPAMETIASPTATSLERPVWPSSSPLSKSTIGMPTTTSGVLAFSGLSSSTRDPLGIETLTNGGVPTDVAITNSGAATSLEPVASTTFAGPPALSVSVPTISVDPVHSSSPGSTIASGQPTSKPPTNPSVPIQSPTKNQPQTTSAPNVFADPT
ncbi:MAG: hypothetical protein Q9220_004791 [cf. Caloplaca sp. 1 TL-2023]